MDNWKVALPHKNQNFDLYTYISMRLTFKMTNDDWSLFPFIYIYEFP